LPFTPASAVTSASISELMTCSPVPTARANKPSARFAVICSMLIVTCSPTMSAFAPTALLWYLCIWWSPVLVVSLDGRPTPTARQESGGGPPLKFYETRDNLRRPCRS
jgi:hypothetical protein